MNENLLYLGERYHLCDLHVACIGLQGSPLRLPEDMLTGVLELQGLGDGPVLGADVQVLWGKAHPKHSPGVTLCVVGAKQGGTDPREM